MAGLTQFQRAQAILKEYASVVEMPLFKLELVNSSLDDHVILWVSANVNIENENIHADPFDAIGSALKKIEDAMLASMAVRNEMKKLEDRLAEEKKINAELIEKLQAAEPYKTHYELELKLRHGDHPK